MLLSPFCCQLSSVLAAMELWTGAQRAFAVKAFYKDGDNFVIVSVNFEESSGFIAIVLFYQPMPPTCV